MRFGCVEDSRLRHAPREDTTHAPILAAATLAAGLFAGEACAASRIARRFLEVDGKVYLDRPCPFHSEPEGSFDIGTQETGKWKGGWFPYVSMTETKNEANCSWNGPQQESRAHDDLGAPTRHDASWSNERATVCAK